MSRVFHFLFSRYFREHHRTFPYARCFSVAIVHKILKTKIMESEKMSAFEDFMTADRLSRRPNGAAVTGIVLGGVGLAAAIGAWIFAPIVAKQGAQANQSAIDKLAAAQLQDRQFAASHQPTTLDYINLSVNPLAFAGASSRAAAVNNGDVGNYGNVYPMPVALYQPAMPCSCNNCG
jgi:hypothetical protein